ncbi:MAG: hypothetical protein RL235_906, partial [Chlamydiota bacterium]
AHEVTDEKADDRDIERAQVEPTKQPLESVEGTSEQGSEDNTDAEVGHRIAAGSRDGVDSHKKDAEDEKERACKS